MNADYSDIRNLIAVEPSWWDEHAVPRYCEFTPRDVANIYADTVCLVRITCQGCGREFKVAFSESQMDKVLHPNRPSLEEAVKTRTLHYGDPPNVNCCAGNTMNSEPREVLEFWQRPDDPRGWDMVRRADLEVDITPDWCK